jgi:hypothetical protein
MGKLVTLVGLALILALIVSIKNPSLLPSISWAI